MVQLEMENLSRGKFKLKLLAQLSFILVLVYFCPLDIVFEVGFDSNSFVAGMLVNDEKTQMALNNCNKKNVFSVELLQYSKRVDIDGGYGFE